MRDVINLAKKIKRARRLADLSQKELGKKLGISDKTISAYELSRAIPPLITLQKIARITNQPVEYFFEPLNSDANKMKKIEKKLDIIMREIKNLSRKTRK